MHGINFTSSIPGIILSDADKSEITKHNQN